MELEQLQAYLESSDSQNRLKALVELRKYDSEIAVPLLISRIQDQEFIVRSYVAMGLGRKQNADSYAALLELIEFERDPNVRAEAANSLSFYGEPSIPHLVALFHKDNNWLVRKSIFAAMADLNAPAELLEICVEGLKDKDLTIQETAVDGFTLLVNTDKSEAALNQLLSLVNHKSWRVRARVASALSKFNSPLVEAALIQLKQDQDHRVVAAVLETLLP
ncbi:HEAT repeat domain-containing protein [Gloeothece verrucosa]|uniref:PBS lyase HEAT domain protein repeat-containing protein n=1 Tax=Gloeothece verrucosa (strain PCC 7822) TaxID=497965 RepID=E0UII4_GLOV7|nr:HEAT repeat domain-containing protein [Gloeothece verrucosa]ADN12178.1 PBS lyase HEAT domain protein repeat-containing protein [Gloeothece verrucosa PCC 7822]